jgi:uncharacterized membrane protein
MAPLQEGSHMPELTSGVLVAIMTVISIVIFGVMLFFAMVYWQRRDRGADQRSDRAAARLFDQAERDEKDQSAP